MSKLSNTLLPVALLALVAGCASTGPVNPSFDLDFDGAGKALKEMEEHPLPLERPLVILGGYLDPGLGSWWTGLSFRKLTSDRRILELNFVLNATFDGCRSKLIEAVDGAFPSADPVWTTEVDVVAISMGGLVARTAAAPPEALATSSRRLKIHRLFTISSPHRGARLARLPCLLPLHRDMRAGSPFIHRLEEALSSAGYEIYPYVRLRDWTVGPENAAPPGRTAWWIAGRPIAPAHMASATDTRIRADIARRLRGEPAYTRTPAAPLPGTVPTN